MTSIEIEELILTAICVAPFVAVAAGGLWLLFSGSFDCTES